MSLDKVEELVPSIKFDEDYNYEDNKQLHRDIYDEVVSLAKHNDSDSLGQPPHFLVFYAARNMLYPAFIIGQVPELLNFLATIDTYRQFAVRKSNEALTWHNYYENEQRAGGANDVRLLAEEEVRRLQSYVTGNDDDRKQYILLIEALIWVHLYYIWNAPESCLLAKRLQQFFPGSFEGTDMPPPLQFHVDLFEEEKARIGELKEECRRWMSQVAEWDATWEEESQRQGLSKEDMEAKYKDDFRERFPPPFDPPEVAQNVKTYINTVEGMVEKLIEWFGPSHRAYQI